MKKLLQKRELLMHQIEGCSGFLRGSITSVCSTCNRAKCICSEKSKGKAYRLTYKDANQKSHTVYIPQKHLSKAQEMVENYSKIRKLIDELQNINVAIFKQYGK